MGRRKKRRGQDRPGRAAAPAATPVDANAEIDDRGPMPSDPPRRNLPLLIISSALMVAWILFLIWLVLYG